MRISDWSSDVCSSDLRLFRFDAAAGDDIAIEHVAGGAEGYAYWRLYDPIGRLVTPARYFGGTQTVSVGMTGTYTLAIEGRVWDNAPLAFGLRVSRTGNTPPPDRSQAAALAPGPPTRRSPVHAHT